jgi:peptide deformylase
MELKLVDPSDPILRQKCQPYDFNTTLIDINDLAQSMVRLIHNHGALGVAANQVGYGLRIFALRAYPQNFLCINPRIVWTSEKQVTLEEGCLTYPNLIVKVKRPEYIRARFFLPNGEVKTEKFIGMTARCFQHELDHLDGIVFYEKANRYHRDQAFKRRKQVEAGRFKYNLTTSDAKVEMFTRLSSR